MRRGAVLAVLLAAAPAAAHELGPLQVKVEFRADGTHAVEVILDQEHLPELPPPAGSGPQVELPEAITPRTRAFVASYLAGATAAFDGREGAPGRIDATSSGADLALRWVGRTPSGARTFTWRERATLPYHPVTLAVEGEAPVQQWIEGGTATEPFPLTERVVPTRAGVFRTYLKLGFEHIVPLGLDHVLFVLGLFLLSRRPGPLLAQVSAFTLAHTLSLALAMRGTVSLPAALVEPLIAASIVYVAVENLVTRRLQAWRPALVFGFGLLHGLGFAGVLREIGVPPASFLPALVGFNVGVEVAQLAVVGAAFLVTLAAARREESYRRWIVVPGSLLIAATGAWWMLQRTLLA